MGCELCSRMDIAPGFEERSKEARSHYAQISFILDDAKLLISKSSQSKLEDSTSMSISRIENKVRDFATRCVLLVLLCYNLTFLTNARNKSVRDNGFVSIPVIPILRLAHMVISDGPVDQ